MPSTAESGMKFTWAYREETIMSRHEWGRLARRSQIRGPLDTWQAFQLRLAMGRRATPRKIINLAAVKIQKRLRVDKLRCRPYRYKIDPTNTCPLRCPLCPTGLRLPFRKSGFMDESLYRRIIDQIARDALLLDLFGWGEPLLHPNLDAMIHYAVDRGIFTRMSSTLCLPGWRGAESLVASGLDSIIVAVDGIDEATYGLYRREGRLSDVLDNLASLVAARARAGRKTPHLTVRMLVHRANEHQVDQVRALSRRLGADAFTVGPIVVDTDSPDQIERWIPVGSPSSGYNKELINHGSCDDLWESLAINWDGGVAPCCWIYEDRYDLANLADEPLLQVWNSPAFRAARRSVAGKVPIDGAPQVVCSLCSGRPAYLSTRPGT